MLTYPWLAIVLSAAALFFASFLSWMVLQLHARDWIKLGREDDFLKTMRDLSVSPGNYMFPGCETPADMNTPEYKQKWEAGPVGVLSVFPQVGMGKKLALTFLFFLVVSFCLAYLTRLAYEDPSQVGFSVLFRFVATAALLTYLASMVQHAIWFHSRIVGHIIESVAYAAITGLIFAALWPGAGAPTAPSEQSSARQTPTITPRVITEMAAPAPLADPNWQLATMSQVRI